jgi:Zn ribbon nucleic-acid-binding protein
MKCISIKQPWAWLICSGHKDIENRTWATKFRGECFIHASKGMTNKEYVEAMACPAIDKDLLLKMPDFTKLQRGGIIGKCEIVDVVTQSDSLWFSGPVGWRVRNAMHFSQLHPIKGQLSFFEVEEKFVYHEEQIICPMCEELQTATVEHTIPWYSFVHECSKCGYIITESEWEAPTETKKGDQA